MTITLASNFLAGSLISLLMPVALLIALVVWYHLAVQRVPGGESDRSEHEATVSDPQAAGGSAGSPHIS